MNNITIKRLGPFALAWLNIPRGNKSLPAQSRAQNAKCNLRNGNCEILRQIHLCTLHKQLIGDNEHCKSDAIKLPSNNSFVNQIALHRKRQPWSFGFMFDIDGVLVRGKRLIPQAAIAIKKVLQLKIPTIFLTNGGCETEDHKAKVLSTQLHHKIHADQIVLSHSPLRKLAILHDKNVVVSGQGPIAEIASGCGFKNVSTLEEINEAHPLLDVNDRRRRFRAPPARYHNMKRIDGILLLGEPIYWETHLQVLVDLLVTNGRPNESLKKIPNENIPVIAANPDLLWMSEATNPRFGHGAFLCCLEALYKKLTGKELVYTSVLGKPNLFTYKYASECLIDHAIKCHGENTKVERIYAIGDNIDTDIYGANTYKNFLMKSKSKEISCKEDKFCTNKWKSNSVTKIESILVRTGVSSIETSLPQRGINHLHKDTMYNPELTMPDYIVSDVLEAVDLVFHKEQTSM